MSETDADMVREAQRGNARAFEALVRRHLKDAYAVARAGVGNDDDAEDVCQDAFIAALRRIRECRQPERFRAWLLAIVRNRAHNFRDQRDRREGRLAAEDLAGAADGDPAHAAARSELRGHLAAALGTLTQLQREVLMRHDYEGWKHAEIAEALGISVVASRFHLHVARRAMRARLSELYARESIA